jgi:hypothetical protein
MNLIRGDAAHVIEAEHHLQSSLRNVLGQRGAGRPARNVESHALVGMREPQRAEREHEPQRK